MLCTGKGVSQCNGIFHVLTFLVIHQTKMGKPCNTLELLLYSFTLANLHNWANDVESNMTSVMTAGLTLQKWTWSGHSVGKMKHLAWTPKNSEIVKNSWQEPEGDHNGGPWQMHILNDGSGIHRFPNRKQTKAHSFAISDIHCLLLVGKSVNIWAIPGYTVKIKTQIGLIHNEVVFYNVILWTNDLNFISSFKILFSHCKLQSPSRCESNCIASGPISLSNDLKRINGIERRFTHTKCGQCFPTIKTSVFWRVEC